MGHITLGGNPGIEILLKRSGRARRLSLRVSQLDGRVTMTLPSGVSERQARRFAEEKADWIAGALDRREPQVVVGPGIELPVEGLGHRVVAGTGRAARIGAGQIAAPPGREGRAIAALLKHMARDRLAAAVSHHAVRLGRPFGRLTLRDTRSRWGSCSHEGNLMFSWRLVLAAPEVLDYVAAHEVAHLERMDHSPAFWGVVADLCPDYRTPRGWLRRNGHALHRFRFD
jgi:predicted metal-dependent hydrolase